MFDPVGSTSWHNRHLDCFQRLDAMLMRESVIEPTVMIVGPGGVTRALAWLLNDAAAPSRSRSRKLLGDAARYGDQLLRRIPGMPLRSLEPVEAQRALSIPHRLIVADRSQRVLSAVARDLPETTRYCVDISFQPLPEMADVVVAFNVVCRMENPAVGMAHLAAAVRPGGYLLMDDRSAAAHLGGCPQFAPAAPKIYRHRCNGPERAARMGAPQRHLADSSRKEPQG